MFFSGENGKGWKRGKKEGGELLVNLAKALMSVSTKLNIFWGGGGGGGGGNSGGNKKKFRVEFHGAPPPPSLHTHKKQKNKNRRIGF